MQISESYVKTCKFKNRYFGISIFLLFQISFWFKKQQWLQDIQGEFFESKLRRKTIFKNGSKMKKKPIISAKIVQKWLRGNFRNFDSRRFKQKQL